MKNVQVKAYKKLNKNLKLNRNKTFLLSLKL